MLVTSQLLRTKWNTSRTKRFCPTVFFPQSRIDPVPSPSSGHPGSSRWKIGPWPGVYAEESSAVFSTNYFLVRGKHGGVSLQQLSDLRSAEEARNACWLSCQPYDWSVVHCERWTASGWFRQLLMSQFLHQVWGRSPCHPSPRTSVRTRQRMQSLLCLSYYSTIIVLDIWNLMK